MTQRLIPVTVGGQIEYIPDPAQDDSQQSNGAQGNASNKNGTNGANDTI